MIEAVIVCVVETGVPKCVAIWMTLAAVVSAANPWMGSSFTTFDPR
jgi:membrane protein implicated in regulation of membrane protease activity